MFRFLFVNQSFQSGNLQKRSSFDWNLEQIKDPGEFNFSPHQQLLSFITFVHQNKFFIGTYLFNKTQAIHTVLLTHRAGEIFSLFRGIWQILERYCIADHPGVGGGVMLNFLPKLKVLVTFHYEGMSLTDKITIFTLFQNLHSQGAGLSEFPITS